MLDRSLAILGMDSADPFLVGLVGRLGRQAVNQQIFGGAAILDAVAEIDFETADAGDALDPRQFRLALLQRAMSRVALVRDFLQMLPQAFGGGSFRQRRSKCPKGSCVPATSAGTFTQEAAALPASFALCG